MSLEIAELTPEDAPLVTPFLVGQGLSADVVSWKYFHAFREGKGPRGYMALSSGRVLGFLGLVPVSIHSEGGEVEASWSCDWYVDDRSSKGALGLLILKHAIAANKYLVHIGGNHLSRRIFERLALRNEPDGAVVYHLSLRVGDYLARARRRFGPKLPGTDWLARIPVRRKRGRLLGNVAVQEDPPDELTDLLSYRRPGLWYPSYAASHIRWLLWHCPDLDKFICWAQRPGGQAAAALFWASKSSIHLWRMTAWCAQSSFDLLGSVVARGVREVDQRGGFGIRVLTSVADEMLDRCLRKAGFSPHSRLPFHVLAQGDPQFPSSAAAGLSYLDQDLVQIFE